MSNDGWIVWFDKKAIRLCDNWREEFMTGVLKSAMIVCLLSKGAINHSCDIATATEKDLENAKKRSYPMLTADSPCDNVLLEQRLAVESYRRGWGKICPILIGQQLPSGDYGDYFLDGSHPNTEQMDTTVVAAVETELHGFMSLHSLEVLQPDRTISQILRDITDCNGKKIEGNLDVAFKVMIDAINEKLIEIGRTPSGAGGISSSSSTSSSSSSSSSSSRSSTIRSSSSRSSSP